MTLVDLAALNAMRAERDAALAENARLRAAVEGVADALRASATRQRCISERALERVLRFAIASALAAPTADDGAERGAR